MPKSLRRLAVALFVFMMLGALSANFVLAQSPAAEPAAATPAQPTLEEPNPIPVWLAGGIAEVCYEPFNGCQPTAPGPCCWRCPGGSPAWVCTTATSTANCKGKCQTACGTTCGWI